MTEQQKQFIDNHFYEGQTDSELDKTKFDLLTSPYELDYIANKHNWDNGVKLLQWIAESPLCSEATALLLFWQAQPSEYQDYKLTQTLSEKYQEYENDIFSLIKTIYRNFQEGIYLKTDIHFDPSEYMNVPTIIPDFMKKEIQGEEPYIYFEDTEVNSWFGEYLKNRIERCDSTIELFNIASFVKYNFDNRAEFILNHLLCDKATACMIFWRLKTYGNLFYNTSTLLQEITSRIQNNFYPEILAYAPLKDANIKVNEPKPKWVIPQKMKEKV